MTLRLVLVLLAVPSAPALHAATFTVNTTADLADTNPGDGFCATTAFNCSLRAAIQEANTTPAADTIAFAIPGPGVHTLQTATLPIATAPLMVDGFTQPGTQPNTSYGGMNGVLLIELSGGLSLRGGQSTARGLVVNGGMLEFGGTTIFPNVVEGCYIGTDPTGTLDRSSGVGLHVIFTSGPVRIGGTLPAQRNLISGNTSGVLLQCGFGAPPCMPGSQIHGNLIGTTASGADALPNDIGIDAASAGNVSIGGTQNVERNVISGNGIGIRFSGNSGSGTLFVHGNTIGGSVISTALPNGTGIETANACVGPGCGSGGAPRLDVRGSAATPNVIAGNTGDGIRARAGSLTMSETLVAQNGGNGVLIETFNSVLVSGEIADSDITSNGGHGIVGIAPNPTAAITVSRNRLFMNGQAGVALSGAFRARLSENQMVDNGALGIDLGGDGITANDFLDQDAGPNDLMNFPVLTSACVSGGGPVNVRGTMHSRPNAAVTLEFFRSTYCDPSGHGEGRFPIGTLAVTTDSAGNAPFTWTTSNTSSTELLTAVATSAAGETSEFSACRPVLQPPPPPPQLIGGPATVCLGEPFLLSTLSGAASYTWLLNGTPIAGATQSSYYRPAASAADAGAYVVRASNGCGVEVTSPPHDLAVIACAAFPIRIDVDRHAQAGTVSDLNGILEVGETALLEPRYRNDSAAAFAMTATAIPGGTFGQFALVDPNANHGTVAPGQLTDCFGSTGDCYRAWVPQQSRPLGHWDRFIDETPNTGHPGRRWLVHIGETFTDVPRSDLFYRFVETIVHHGVTSGCALTDYCPAAGTTREQMAVFVLVAKDGQYQRPPDCDPAAPRFADVPASSGFCRWIEELARRGVVAGCGGNDYCPAAPVSREQMAVFVLATREAPGYAPPACVAGSEAFADVPASSPFCRWVEELARRGVVAGCGNGNFCPGAAITRGEMSVFLTGTFGLLLYGP